MSTKDLLQNIDQGNDARYRTGSGIKGMLLVREILSLDWSALTLKEVNQLRSLLSQCATATISERDGDTLLGLVKKCVKTEKLRKVMYLLLQYQSSKGAVQSTSIASFGGYELI